LCRPVSFLQPAGLGSKAKSSSAEAIRCITFFGSRRSVKYEDIYLKDYGTVPELDAGLTDYFRFYNHERLHQSLDYRTPAELHFG
jgi:transposase InsO family protein